MTDRNKNKRADRDDELPSKRLQLPLSTQRVSWGDGASIEVVTDPMNDVFTYNIGNSLWSASLELVKYLDETNHPTASFASAVEVGAGCGCLGLALWRRGCKRVILSDLDEMIPIMEHNISHNDAGGTDTEAVTDDISNGVVSARALDWSDRGEGARALVSANDGPFDLIVGAEVSYDYDLHEGLLETLSILSGFPLDEPPSLSNTSATPDVESALNGVAPATDKGTGGQEIAPTVAIGPVILLAIPLRDRDAEIVEVAARKGFTVTRVKLCASCSDHSSPVGIFELRRLSS